MLGPALAVGPPLLGLPRLGLLSVAMLSCLWAKLGQNLGLKFKPKGMGLESNRKKTIDKIQQIKKINKIRK